MEPCGVFCVSLLLLVLVGPGAAQSKHPLPVLWMVDQNSSVDLAVRLALRDLAEQPAPLGNYAIQLHVVESKCELSAVLKSLFDTMWAGPKYLLVLGGACPSVMPTVARALPPLHLLQLAFRPAASYRNLFSIAPSPRAVTQAAAELLLHHNWTRVGLVSEHGLAEMRRDLIGRLVEVKVQVIAIELLWFDTCSSLRKMKGAGVRIFIGLLDQDSVSEVFCCAYRLNLFGPRYQWIVAGPVGEPGAGRRWRPQGFSCGSDSIQTAAEGSIRLQVQFTGDPNTPSVSGRTPQSFFAAFARTNQDWAEVSSLHGYAYDGVWVAAKALSQVMEAVKQRERLSRKVSEDVEEKLLLEAVRQTQFQGVTGPVSFRHGQRMTTIQLLQSQGNSEVTVGWFRTDDQQLRLLTHRLRFKGSGPARGQTLVRQERRGVSLLLYLVMSSVAAATVFLTLVVLLLVTVKHSLWLSRWRSGCQDRLLLLGLLLSSCSVLVSGLDHVQFPDRTAAILCSVHQWILSLGHTLSVSVLLSRSWRFSSQAGVTQQQQNLLVLFLFLLDVFVLASWQVLDPLRRVETQHAAEDDPVEPDVLLHPVSDLCSCSNLHLWTSSVYVSRGPLLGLSCFLAWNTRSSRTEQTAPERTHLRLCVFSVALFAATGASTSLLPTHSPSVHFCLTSSLVLCCNITVLAFMFGAKLVALCSSDWEPQSENDDTDDQLNIFNWQLKSRVATLDLEIRSIMMQLSEEEPGGGVQALRCVTHAAQIYAPNTGPGNINSPEHVRRRLSVQLPILHHSYLPAVGGVSASSSSQFGSREAIVYVYDHFLFT
ncbi:gamma-aminobutyric acid type B receptor subunit 2-like isoform X2 [Synchiropus splendidus]|uniref:gamma-aminobutyric acid type B receptor subunit 2-like isoform X2 n=1 Tax=Synchiropus splendidus TaxID=270530 RepID=UPI00237DD411|nr:gamma-aminobutyric acid type B receptor subunit 2-like isoform X2 [Synchiropus splendidus]